MKLPYEFYNRHTVEVARDLLGKKLVFGPYQGIITETEAYRGPDDEASHSFKGLTPRTVAMFGPAGHSYVYFIYGMYYCLNIVTEEEGIGSGVLIRGLKIADLHLNGPGKLTKHLGITKEHYGINLVQSNNFYVDEGVTLPSYTATPRIGISKAQDKLWRFIVNNIKSL